MAKLNIQDYYKNQANSPYALNTDANYYKNMYDQATAAAQAVEERSIANAETAWQRNLAGTQATALDTIRKNNASAIATGASKGMQAANELSAVLGLQDAAVEESTALAQQRLDLADTYAAEYAKNAVTAQETANANKQAMMNAAMQQYGYDATTEAARYNSESTGLIAEALAAYERGETDLGNTIMNSLGTNYTQDEKGNTGTTVPQNMSSKLYVNTDAHANAAPILSRDRKIHLTEVGDDGKLSYEDYRVHEKAPEDVKAKLLSSGMTPGQIMKYGEHLYIMGHSNTIRRITVY